MTESTGPRLHLHYTHDPTAGTCIQVSHDQYHPDSDFFFASLRPGDNTKQFADAMSAVQRTLNETYTHGNLSADTTPQGISAFIRSAMNTALDTSGLKSSVPGLSVGDVKHWDIFLDFPVAYPTAASPSTEITILLPRDYPEDIKERVSDPDVLSQLQTGVARARGLAEQRLGLRSGEEQVKSSIQGLLNTVLSDIDALSHITARIVDMA